MQQKLRLVIAQLNFLVGDIAGNLKKIIASAQKIKMEQQADVVIFPELALSGYPPDDLLLRPDFHAQIKTAIETLKSANLGIDIIFGYPEQTCDGLYNSVMFIGNNQILGNYRKRCLPNYGVFDEKRYFIAGSDNCVIPYKGVNIGLLICEDLWFSEPSIATKQQNAELLIAINASPFDVFKLRERERILKARIDETHLPIIYAHMIGGQDELLFDGRSMVINEHGETTHLAEAFTEDLIIVDLEKNPKPHIIPGKISQKLPDDARAYNALVLATKDYIEKNRFPGALIGLSGGIDSAITLCIAVDAIGADKVHAVIMPSRYTADISVIDAIQIAENLNVKYSTISIEPTFAAFLESLAPEFANTAVNIAEENIQARCRGVLLMALSNKFGKLLLTTGNKSEMAVGYATLYGDMAGGFAPLKDVYKTLVYQLAEYRNSIKPVIPARIIERAPSAELRLDQTDQDSLPPYPVLDEILQRYVEQDQSVNEITAAGFAEPIVHQILQLVDKNEYKRRQAPPGVKITSRAFGRDRRYPITSGFGK